MVAVRLRAASGGGGEDERGIHAGRRRWRSESDGEVGETAAKWGEGFGGEVVAGRNHFWVKSKITVARYRKRAIAKRVSENALLLRLHPFFPFPFIFLYILYFSFLLFPFFSFIFLYILFFPFLLFLFLSFSFTFLIVFHFILFPLAAALYT